MKTNITTYGEDADGNRGKKIIEYELEPSDDDDIKNYILKNITDEDYEDIIIVPLEDVDFDIKISDYLTAGEFNMK